MFGTLRLGVEDKSVEFIEHAKGEAARALGRYVFSHSACENCRLKKLRCSGRKSGCDRCRSQALKCTYQAAAPGKRVRPQSASYPQNNFSNVNHAAGGDDAPGPLDDSGGQKMGGWERHCSMDETSSTRDHFGHAEQPDPNDASQGLRLDEFDYPESELDDHRSNIAWLQADDMDTSASLGDDNRGLLDPVAFASTDESAHFMLDSPRTRNGTRKDADDIGDIAMSQPASDSQSFMALDRARTASSSSADNSSDALTSSAIAASFGRARSRTETTSCGCFRSIIQVLDRIEANILSANPSNMYALLSYQRRTMAASNAVLRCRICNSKTEFIGLLVITAEKITNLSEAIIAAFVCRVEEQDESMNFGGPSPLDGCPDPNSTIRLGQFKVETKQEFKVVSAAVIKLQLKYSVAFVSRTRELASLTNRRAQIQSLQNLEERLKQLFLKIQRIILDAESDHEST